MTKTFFFIYHKSYMTHKVKFNFNEKKNQI